MMIIAIITLMITILTGVVVKRVNNTKLIESAKDFLTREEKKGSFRATCELDSLRGSDRREALRRAKTILVYTSNYRAN